MIEAPIIHVNGDDPEAVVYAAKIAIEFRQKFHKPVVIDMFCYRRYGHNEGDEPSFTQPLMYKKIRAHKSTLEIYSEKLIAEGVVTQGEVDKLRADWRSRLDAEYEAGQVYKPNKADWLDGRWAGMRPATELGDDPRRGQTGVDLDKLKEMGLKISSVPEGFNVHRTIPRFLDGRRKMIETGEGVDWAMGEALAFGSLVDENHRVRLSGQDCERGTFSQRHSVLIDQETEARYVPLNNVRDGQARYEVINSMLSEEAVLGFEYGYSLAEPDALVMWEAQFGDFANGAQVLFDQFISSGERKWLRMSGLVCLLPHGYEGQGPEHSSARAVSRLDEMAAGTTFHRLLWDDAENLKGEKIKLVKDDKIRRVVLCTGKVYYDLYEEREKREIDDIYLLRVEQLYPFPLKALVTEMSRFKKADVVWCQEEPKNMGSWSFVEPYLEWVLGQVGGKSKRARYLGRPASAATATGLMSKHLAQLKAFLDEAFAA